jgi:hypothetical protein
MEPSDTTNMNAAPGAQTVTLGVGGPTSGEAGSTVNHETMAETGGSGGAPMTKPSNQESAPLAQGSGQPSDIGSRSAAGSTAGTSAGADAEGAGSDATATTRGFQDTRSAQASSGSTGLGAPESGGNQTGNDLAPPRQS